MPAVKRKRKKNGKGPERFVDSHGERLNVLRHVDHTPLSFLTVLIWRKTRGRGDAKSGMTHRKKSDGKGEKIRKGN